MKKTIAILLTCHNRRAQTIQCLDKLFVQKLSDTYSFKIYLVDDGCTDGTVAAVTKNFPTVRIIKGDGTLYWNRGMHKAWKVAAAAQAYDYYFWLNDDTILIKSALNELLSTARSFNNKSIVVGTTCSTKNNNEITYGGRDKYGKIIDPNNQPQPCHFFNGNIVLIPKYVHEKAGTNDPFFRHSLGDFDYGLRAGKLGVKMYVSPNVLGTCDHPDALSSWSNPKINFVERWKAFRSPLGNNPEEYFVYRRRHENMLIALFHYFTNHLRVIYPQLWT